MTSKKGPISEDTLESLAFERCTWWSSFFEAFSEREDGEVYSVDEIDETFMDDSSDEEEREYAEEAEEVDAPEDIDHRSLLNSMTLHEKNSFIESSEFQDILNATLPVLEEHERKWKNAGLESILNTFDSVRIKKEVGVWMRRNHSVTTAEVGSDSGTDSSISWDTGHYIRSTKKMNIQRGRNRIKSIRRLKNFKQARHNHGMVIEATRYRAYKCNCCKYNQNGANKMRQSRVIEQAISDTDEKGSQKKLCSDMYIRDQLVPMKENKYDSPSSSSAEKNNFINTASPRVTNKRMAAMKALEKLAAMNKENTLRRSSDNILKTGRLSKRSRKNGASSEYSSSFENELMESSISNTNSIESIEAFDPEERLARSSIDAVNLISISNTDSEELVKTVKKPTKTPKTIESIKTLNLGKRLSRNLVRSISTSSTDLVESSKAIKQAAKTPKTNKAFSLSSEDIKENTFLTNVENICNSTALNGVAARKQLISRPPTINKNSKTMSSTPRGKRMPNQNNCHTTTPKRYAVAKQVTRCLPTISENSICLSDTPRRLKTGLKKIYKSKELNEVKSRRELEICSPPPEGRFSGTVIQDTPEPRYGKKQTIVLNERKSPVGTNNVLPVRLNTDTPTKSITLQRIDKILKPQRIQLYKPQQKQQTSDSCFQVTRELLSSVIGEKKALRFFKYHLGRLTFPNTSTVYYCPPEEELSSSDSDDDPLQKIGRCGELNESVQHEDNDVV